MARGVRPLPGLILFVVIFAAVALWMETFPTAHGRSAAELRATPFGRMATPAGASLISSTFSRAEWSGRGLSGLPVGSTPQVLCARLRQEYATTDPEIVRTALMATASASGIDAVDIDAWVQGRRDLWHDGVAVGYEALARGPGESRVVITISDLPAPLGGWCTGGRLGTYETIFNW
jgi:hypothetical protein